MPFDLDTIIKSTLFGPEFGVWGFVDVIIAIQVPLILWFPVESLELIIFIKFIIRVFVFVLVFFPIFAFGLQGFWDSVKTILI